MGSTINTQHEFMLGSSSHKFNLFDLIQLKFNVGCTPNIVLHAPVT